MGGWGLCLGDFGLIPQWSPCQTGALSMLATQPAALMMVVRPPAVVVRMVVGFPLMMLAVGDGPGGGQDKSAALDPLGPDQAVGQLADDLGRAAEEDHLEAAAGVEVDVRG